MGNAIDAVRQAAHDRHSFPSQLANKFFGSSFTVFGITTRTHNRKHPGGIEVGRAFLKQQDGRIGTIQQPLWIIRIGQKERTDLVLFNKGQLFFGRSEIVKPLVEPARTAPIPSSFSRSFRLALKMAVADP